MLRFRSVIFIFFLLCIINETQANVTPPRKFTVYAYIPWKQVAATGKTDLSAALLKQNIHPIKVIYENGYSTNSNVSVEKIKRIAEETLSAPDVPVSFDLEFGNRFKPESVIPKMKLILTTYHQFKPNALVGVYATMPQNTYGWKANIHSYDKLNERYQSLVNYVDFISPALYNYNGHDFDAWAKSASYNFAAAKKYFPNKPIIPYISPIYRIGISDKIKNGTIVEELDETAMLKRLQYLYALGAAGCIIWASSQDRTTDGQIPTFSPHSGWGKGVIEFIKTHSPGK